MYISKKTILLFYTIQGYPAHAKIIGITASISAMHLIYVCFVPIGYDNLSADKLVCYIMLIVKWSCARTTFCSIGF